MKPTIIEIQTLNTLHQNLHGSRLSFLTNKADSFSQYLNILTGFNVTEYKLQQPHIGRVIVDGVLQQGKDYEKIVRVAVADIIRFNQASTLSGFISLLQQNPLNSLMTRLKKENTKQDLLGTCQYFSAKGLETYNDLRNWLISEEHRDLFRNAGYLGPFFKGGDKTADYFRKLVGHWDAIAVDRGQKQLLTTANLVPFYTSSISYKEKRTILQLTALKLGCRPIDLDESIYVYYVQTNKMTQLRNSPNGQYVQTHKYCHSCGTQVLLTDNYCNKCGAKQH